MKAVKFAYKWLPLFFGCHCMAERSFHYKGRQFPICARCTGELVGLLFGVVGLLLPAPPVWVMLLMLVPLVADGLLQGFTAYESGNIRRLITGILFGYAILSLFALSVREVYGLGRELGLRIRGDI